jgi:hypothetical protein
VSRHLEDTSWSTGRPRESCPTGGRRERRDDDAERALPGVYAAISAGLIFAANVIRRERDRDRVIALEKESDVDEHHADHRAQLVVINRVALGGRDRTGGLTWRTDAEVEHVSVLVVLVLVEAGAGDGDGHDVVPGALSWTKAVTTKAGDSLKSTTTRNRFESPRRLWVS